MFERVSIGLEKGPVKKSPFVPRKPFVAPAKLQTHAKYRGGSVRMNPAITLEKQLARGSIDIGIDLDNIEPRPRRGFR
jgi:hypothetical protein